MICNKFNSYEDALETLKDLKHLGLVRGIVLSERRLEFYEVNDETYKIVRYTIKGFKRINVSTLDMAKEEYEALEKYDQITHYHILDDLFDRSTEFKAWKAINSRWENIDSL